VSGSGVEAHFRDELIDENHNTDSADKTTQEWSAEDRIQETESAQSSCENDSTGETCDHACYLGVLAACVVTVMA
jgi:hypothetical protein